MCAKGPFRLRNVCSRNRTGMYYMWLYRVTFKRLTRLQSTILHTMMMMMVMMMAVVWSFSCLLSLDAAQNENVWRTLGLMKRRSFGVSHHDNGP